MSLFDLATSLVYRMSLDKFSPTLRVKPLRAGRLAIKVTFGVVEVC